MVAKVKDWSGRPRLLVAYTDSAYAARIGRAFRRLGWEVHMAASAAEAQRQIAIQQPNAVVLDVGLPDETGWSVSTHIAATHPQQLVVLLAPDRPADTRERLRAAGAAALVTRNDGIDCLVRAVHGGPLAKAV